MSNSVATVLDQLLSTWERGLTPATAEEVLRFQLDDQTQRRIAELADGANEGLLSEADMKEYGEYVELIDLLALFKAKARQVLTRRAAP